MLRVIPTAIGLCFVATTAWAQSPDIRGRWLAKTAGCDDLIMTINAQAANGVIEGTIDCTKQKLVGPFGEKLIQGKQMSGKFDGADLNIEGSVGNYTRLKMENGKLVGYTAAPGLGRTGVTYVRQ